MTTTTTEPGIEYADAIREGVGGEWTQFAEVPIWDRGPLRLIVEDAGAKSVRVIVFSNDRARMIESEMDFTYVPIAAVVAAVAALARDGA